MTDGKSAPQRALCRAAVLCLLLLADTPAPAEIMASVSLTSDYLWRGISKSGGDPAVQAQLDYQHTDGWYLGAVLSNVDFAEAYERGYRRYGDGGTAELELVPYLGYVTALDADWQLGGQLSFYLYEDPLFDTTASYHEAYVTLHYRDLFTAEAAVAPDAYDQDGTTLSVSGVGRYPISAAITASAGAGWFEASDVLGADYAYWHAGLTWQQRHGGVDVRYFGAARRSHRPGAGRVGAAPANGEVVVTLTIGF